MQQVVPPTVIVKLYENLNDQDWRVHLSTHLTHVSRICDAK